MKGLFIRSKTIQGGVLGILLAALVLVIVSNQSAVHGQAKPFAVDPGEQILWSFETGVEGWSGSVVSGGHGGTAAITTTHVTDGSQALQLDVDSDGGFFSRQQGTLDFTGWTYFKFDIYSDILTNTFVAFQSGGWTWQQTEPITLNPGANTVSVDLTADFGGPLADPARVQAIHLYFPAGAGTLVMDAVRLDGYVPPPTSTSTPTIGATPTPLSPLPGFRVVGPDLYDYCGEKVVLRGVNKMVIWTDINGNSFPEIAKTGANSVRIVWLPSGDPAQLDVILQKAIDNGLIPMVGLWNTTGDWDQLTKALEYWLRPDVLAVIQKYEKYLLVNIGNEAGDASITEEQFKSRYRYLILRMRQEGIHTPLVIDSQDWGKNINMLQATGPYLLAADPEHNLIFDVHAYWPGKWGYSEQFVIDEFAETAAMGLPLVIGEFGNAWDNDGSPGDEIPYKLIIQEAYRYGFGFYPWEWGPGNNPQTHLNMTDDSTYDTLHGWGLEVAVTDPYSILNTSDRPYSILHGSCAGPEPTEPPVPTPYNDAPTVELVAPAFDAMFDIGDSVELAAEAADLDGTVSKVEFYVNDVKIGEDTTEPFTYTWASATLGEHWLSAVAVDDDAASSPKSLPGHILVGMPAFFSINDATIAVTDTEVLKFYYTGTWNTSGGEGKFHNDDHYSDSTASCFQFRFTGTQITLLGTKAAHHGIGTLTLDGGAVEDIDYYAAERDDQVPIWTSDQLRYGEHVLSVCVKGEHNPASSGNTITVDRVFIVSSEAVYFPYIAKRAQIEPPPEPTKPTNTATVTATLEPPATRTPYPTNLPTATPTPVPTGAPVVLFDFETGVEGWSGAGSVAITTTHVTHGAQALQVNSTGGWFQSDFSPAKDFSGKKFLKLDIYSPSSQSVKIALQNGSGWTWSETTDISIPAGESTVAIDLENDFTPALDVTEVHRMNIYFNAWVFVMDYVRLEGDLVPPPISLFSFETGVEGWSGAGSVAVTSTHVTDGVQALQVNSTGGWFQADFSPAQDFSGAAFLKFDIYSTSNQSVKIALQTGSGWAWNETTDKVIPAGMSTVWVDLAHDFSGGPLPNPEEVHRINIYFNAATFVMDYVRLENVSTYLPPAASLIFDFEADVEGWSATGTVALTGTHVTHGAQALQIVSSGGWAQSDFNPAQDFSGAAFLKFDIYSTSNQSVKIALQTGSGWAWNETTDIVIPAGYATVWVDLNNAFGGPLPNPEEVHRINVYFNAATFVVDFFRIE